MDVKVDVLTGMIPRSALLIEWIGCIQDVSQNYCTLCHYLLSKIQNHESMY